MKRILILLILFLPLVNADVLSINSGGGDNIIVNPDIYLEGFFSGDFDVAVAICGNSIIETGEECDDGNVVSGDGCSSSCANEDEDGGGGGGGGGAGVSQITVTPNNVTLNLAVNTNKEQVFVVENTGDTIFNITVFQNNLDGKIIVSETSFTLSPGETKDLVVTFVASSETGIFSGTLNIGGELILVTLNVKTKLLLFDSNIVVLNDDYIVPRGSKLKTSVTLIPMGDKERLDVTLNYVIKDFDGRDYLTRSETVLVEEQVNFQRNFDTGILPIGQYVVGLELIYPNGVAPSSAQFEIIAMKETTFFGKVVLYLIYAILIILVLIIIFILARLIKQIIINKKFEKKSQTL